MADKTIILEIKTNQKKIDDTKLSVLNLKKGVSDFKTESKKQGTATDEVNKKLVGYQNELKKTNENLKEITKIQKLNNTIVKSAKGSYDQLNAQLTKSKLQWKALSKSQRENGKEGKRLTAQQANLTKQLTSLDAKTGVHNRNVGNYSGGIKDAFKQTGLFSRELALLGNAQKIVTAGTNTGTKAMKIFKIALASTGIGLLIVAIGSLVAFFKSSEEGAFKLQKILVPFKILFGNLKDLFISVGETLVNVFSNPRESLEKLLEAIKTNFINRFKAIGVIASGIAKIFKGEFKEGAKVVSDGLIQMGTGVADFSGKLEKGRGAIRKFADETRRETARAMEIEELKFSLLKRTRNINLENARIEQEIARLRVIVNNKEQFSAEEREKAVIAWDKAIQERAKTKIELAEKELEIIKTQNSFATSGSEDLQAQSEAEIKLVQATTEAFQAQMRMVTQLTTVKRELAKKAKDLNLEIIEEEDDFKDEQFDRDIERANELSSELIEIAKEEAEAKLQFEEDTQNAIVELRKRTVNEAINLGNTLFNFSSALSGRQSILLDRQLKKDLKAAGDDEKKREDIERKFALEKAKITRKQAILDKAQALLNIGINTAMAVTAVLSTGGGTRFADFGVSAGILSALVVAAGAVQAGIVLAKPLPEIPTFSKGTVISKKGQMLQGASHAEGGIKLYGEGEGGEPVLTKSVMSSPVDASIISAINVKHGGIPLYSGHSNYYQDGGVTTQIDTPKIEVIRVPVLVVEDVHDIEDTQQQIKVLETL